MSEGITRVITKVEGEEYQLDGSLQDKHATQQLAIDAAVESSMAKRLRGLSTNSDLRLTVHLTKEIAKKRLKAIAILTKENYTIETVADDVEKNIKVIYITFIGV